MTNSVTKMMHACGNTFLKLVAVRTSNGSYWSNS